MFEGAVYDECVTVRAGVAHSSAGVVSPVRIEHLITITGTVNSRPIKCVMLVDSGATTSFIAAAFVNQHGIGVDQLTESLLVKMANGQPVGCKLVVRQATVCVVGHTGKHDLVVLPDLDGFDVILGRSFLKEAGAIVNHATDAVEFGRTKRKVKIAKSSCRSAVFAALVKEIVTDQQSTIQDRILVAYGLTASPVGCESVANLEHVPSAVEAAVLRVVTTYETRMMPMIGRLPPSRGQFDHSITLISGDVRPKARRAIPLSNRHQRALAKELAKLQSAGFIRPSRSEWAAPVFFVPKDELEDRMICDYRALNSVTETNSASLPYVKELFARLSDCVIFSKLDLTSGYHQLRLRESDIPLTGFITPHGHFEWLVMPFGEKNAPGSFAQLMSQLVLPDLIHSFVLVFQDDILVASQSDDEHPDHVAQVMKRLGDHQLWIKPQKCQWAVREVDFLGHRIRATSAGTVIEPCQSKIAAVADWPVPVNTSELRSFLGLSNFYRSFVRDFSSTAAPLTALTGARVKFEWSEQHQLAFVLLKDSLCDAPALLAVDDSKPFVLHCDASSFAVGAVLSQHDQSGKLRPVGFFSRKLTDTQLRWDVYEREIYSVVASLEHWFMHLKGTPVPVQIFTDHRSLEELAVQLLRPKMARWLTVLSGFNYRVTWVPAAENVVADALSRRPDHDDGSGHRKLAQTMVAQQLHAESGNHLGPGVELTQCEKQLACPINIQRSSWDGSKAAGHDTCVLSRPTEPGAKLQMVAVSCTSQPLFDRVRELYLQDDRCTEILADPVTHGYQLVGGLLMRHGDRGVLVPLNNDLRRTIIHEAHDTPTSGHMGVAKTLARVYEVFYWPGLSRDVASYVSECIACQRHKHSNQLPAGLLKPLPIVGKGEMLTMDFVGELPRSKRGMNAILVVVDKMTKRAYYEACRTSTTAKQAADIVFRRVVREQGLPRFIISDRDSRFTSKVWKALWEACRDQARVGHSLSSTD